MITYSLRVITIQHQHWQETKVGNKRKLKKDEKWMKTEENNLVLNVLQMPSACLRHPLANPAWIQWLHLTSSMAARAAPTAPWPCPSPGPTQDQQLLAAGGDMAAALRLACTAPCIKATQDMRIISEEFFLAAICYIQGFLTRLPVT